MSDRPGLPRAGKILILVTVEGLLANRFYRESPSRPAARVTS